MKYSMIFTTVIVILFGLLGISQPAYAEIISLTVTSDVEGTTAFIDYVLKVTNKTEEFPLKDEVIYARDTFGDITSHNKNIELLVPLEDGEERIVLIKVKSKEAISKKEEFNEYIYINPLKSTSVQLKHSVILPENSELIETLPDAKKQILDKRIIVSWDEPEDVYVIRYKEKQTPSVLYAIYSLAIILFVALIFAVYFLTKKYIIISKQIKEKEKMINSLKLLNEKEKEIVKIIIEHPGITQYKIMESYKITKSNLSKIIKKLSFNGIIEKRDIGKVNKLYPGEKLKSLGKK